jgi:hypothetical protein
MPMHGEWRERFDLVVLLLELDPWCSLLCLSNHASSSHRERSSARMIALRPYDPIAV